MTSFTEYPLNRGNIVLTLIPKKDQNKTCYPQKCHPISLLNTEYKLRLKYLQWDYKKVLPTISREYQNGT